MLDLEKYLIRPFEATDYDALARINALVEPEFPESAEEARKWNELITKNPGRVAEKLVVEERQSGATVAWGGMTHTLWNYHPDKYSVQVTVHPDHRGRGIGQELYSRLERGLVNRKASHLWCVARESPPASLRFLERQGFVPQRRTWISRLDLTHIDLTKFPDRSTALQDQGIRFTTLGVANAARPEVRRRLYDLLQVAGADVPRMGEYTPGTYEEFVAIELEDPKILPEAIFLALHGEEYVGWSSLQRLNGVSDTLDIGFTGTLPSFRGRGIASELKRRAVEYARSQGYGALITGNDSLNPRILAINEKLGFRPVVVRVHAEKALNPLPT